MKTSDYRYVYGPVPSRRLGRSLGIDLVPYKTCTYDCVYCHLGTTTNKTVERKEYVEVAKILAELERKLAEPGTPDFVSLAGSGEPTLNSGIGELIRGIKGLTSIPVAVLTNGALLWMKEVQDALLEADLVLPSLDAGDERWFQYVNRPHRDISFERMVDGIASFTRRFSERRVSGRPIPGDVWLEVLLLAGSTGVPAEAQKIADLVGRIGPDRVQLNTAFRPPAEGFATPLTMGQLSALGTVFPGRVEVISEPEGHGSRETILGQAGQEDVLELLRRRPCTAADVAKGLDIHVTEAVKHLDALLKSGKTTVVRKDGLTFFAVAEQWAARDPEGKR